MEALFEEGGDVVSFLHNNNVQVAAPLRSLALGPRYGDGYRSVRFLDDQGHGRHPLRE